MVGVGVVAVAVAVVVAVAVAVGVGVVVVGVVVVVVAVVRTEDEMGTSLLTEVEQDQLAAALLTVAELSRKGGAIPYLYLGGLRDGDLERVSTQISDHYDVRHDIDGRTVAGHTISRYVVKIGPGLDDIVLSGLARSEAA